VDAEGDVGGGPAAVPRAGDRAGEDDEGRDAERAGGGYRDPFVVPDVGEEGVEERRRCRPDRHPGPGGKHVGTILLEDRHLFQEYRGMSCYITDVEQAVRIHELQVVLVQLFGVAIARLRGVAETQVVDKEHRQ